MTRSTNMEHVPHLQRMANESWRGSPEHAALTAAIASLSAQQPCGCGEATCTVPWEPGCGLGKSEQHAVVEAAPPSASVGVEGLIERLEKHAAAWPGVYASDRQNVALLREAATALAQQPSVAPVGAEAGALKQAIEEMEGGDFGGGVSHACLQAMKAALAQQPASDGGFTAADMMDARQEGRKEAQQHAACVACEGAPGSENSPCAVCGQQPAAVDGSRET